jgi:hypothetical protein
MEYVKSSTICISSDTPLTDKLQRTPLIFLHPFKRHPDLRISIPKQDYGVIYKRYKKGEKQEQITSDYKVTQPITNIGKSWSASTFLYSGLTSELLLLLKISQSKAYEKVQTSGLFAFLVSLPSSCLS